MKKLLSIVLAVAMMATMAMSASAAQDIDLLATAKGLEKIYANDANYATLTEKDGAYEVVVTQDASADYSAAYGLAVETFLSEVDLTATPYLQMSITSTAPFRITLLDKNAAGDQKWIGFGSEFFNTVFADGSEAPTEPPADNFFPAGTYNCAAFLQGYYDWKTNNENMTGYDAASANVTAIYIELKTAGTLTVSKLALSSTDGSSEDGSSSDDTAATTTAAKTGTTVAQDSAKTGDVSNAMVFVVVAAVAVAVVTVSAVASKKAKSR